VCVLTVLTLYDGAAAVADGPNLLQPGAVADVRQQRSAAFTAGRSRGRLWGGGGSTNERSHLPLPVWVQASRTDFDCRARNGIFL